jgi:hypothetical protein
MKALMRIVLIVVGLGQALTAHAEWWQTALVCDGGAARVEVDLGERRNVQLIITNQDVLKYLASTGLGASVIRGHVDNGIFSSSQFQGFRNQGFSATCYSGYAPTVVVYRTNGGLVVKGYREGAEGCCWEMDSAGHCTSQGSGVTPGELGNWYFRECHEQAITP